MNLTIQHTRNIQPRQISFNQNNNIIIYTPQKSVLDEVKIRNKDIKEIILSPYGNLKSIVFKQPLKVTEVLYDLCKSQDYFISTELLKSLQSPENLYDMSEAFSQIKIINDTKVTSLLGFGINAMVFETQDGEVLKLTCKNHFPDNRKPADFDLPIREKGYITYQHRPYYYYFEEKVNFENLTKSEVIKLINHMKELGYTVVDYLNKPHEINPSNNNIKFKQFGRAKDGKIYLIDPECAIASKKMLDKENPSAFSKFITKLLKPFKL